MVNVIQVASMLQLPDLEAETKAAINQYIRDSLGKPTPVGQAVSPRAAAEQMLGADLVSEWMGDRAEEAK